jgi:hypothetical protein
MGTQRLLMRDCGVKRRLSDCQDGADAGDIMSGPVLVPTATTFATVSWSADDTRDAWEAWDARWKAAR